MLIKKLNIEHGPQRRIKTKLKIKRTPSITSIQKTICKSSKPTSAIYLTVQIPTVLKLTGQVKGMFFYLVREGTSLVRIIIFVTSASVILTRY